ncbi:MAG: trans-sulfuration enzyme family protein [Bacillota bacterium]
MDGRSEADKHGAARVDKPPAGPGRRRFDTVAVQAGQGPSGSLTRAHAPAIEQTAAYVFERLEDVDEVLEGRRAGFMYTRYAGSNQTALESAVAALEGAEAGLAVASGTAALLLAIISAAPAGSEVLATRDLYGGTLSFLRRQLDRLGYRHRLVNMTDLAAVEAGIGRDTRILLAETISNPTMRVLDLDRLAEVAHRRGLVFIGDNTFASPYHCRPVEHGADLVVHSATKYLNGHGDVTAGVLVGPAALVAEARAAAIDFGPTIDPFAAWLALRGLRTLPLRMARQSATARRLADFLATHDRVVRVHYPGLPQDPLHDVAERVLERGFGGMVAFEPRGEAGAAARVIAGLRLIHFVPSLGDIWTTVSHPAKTSHRSLTPEERSALGIGDELIRLSVGLEDPDDLEADLDAALGQA